MASEIFTKKMDRLFRSIDVTNDGVIDNSDFDAVIGAMSRGAIATGGEADFGTSAGNFWRAITGMDADSDARVDAGEFRSAMERTMVQEGAFDAILGPLAELWFGLYDSDGDGGITLDEWLAGLGAHRDPITDLSAGFAALDRNGDGVISKDEWIANLKEYCESEDPAAPGNLLLGPLD